MNVLRLVAGATTINLVWNSATQTNYRVNGDWAPQIAPLQPGDLGGDPVADVTEVITLDIEGSTQVNLYANILAIQTLLTQAVQHARGLAVDPVYLRYQPSGGELGEALLVGDVQELLLPKNFNAGTRGRIVAQAQLRLTRRGRWLATGTETASASAAVNPSALTVTFGSASPVAAPIQLRITGFTDLGAANTAVVAIAPANGIQIVEAESPMFVGGNASVQGMSNARGGQVLRVTGAEFALYPLSGMPATARTFAVIIPLQVTALAFTWQLAAWYYRLINGSYLLIGQSVPVIVSTNASGAPFVIVVPATACAYAPTHVELRISKLGSGGGNLELDSLTIVQMDHPVSQVLRARVGSGAANTAGLIALDALATTPRIFFRESVAQGEWPGSYAGNLAGLHMVGTSVAVAVHRPNGTRFNDPNNLGVTIERRLAWVAPR